MNKLKVCLISILLIGAMSAIPSQAYDNEYFRFIEAYWGTTQKTEVSPGDIATLTIVLRYEFRTTVSNLMAVLYPPEGFEPIGAKDNITYYSSASISQYSIIKLELPMFITTDVKIGSHSANLSLYYSYYLDEPGDQLQIPIEVTGKPMISAKILNDSLTEGEQEISIELTNKGDSTAKNLRLVKVSSSSIVIEPAATRYVGTLAPGSKTTVLLEAHVSEGSAGKKLSLTVDTSYLGPRNIAYQNSETIQISIEEAEVHEEVTITTRYPDVTVEAGQKVQYPTKIENLGEDATLVFLSVTPPSGWKVVFKSGTLEISTLRLEAKTTESLVIEATAPGAANLGDYTIPVQVLSPTGKTYAQMTLRTTIIGSYSLVVVPSTYLTSIAAGTSASFTAKVTNTGQSTITGLALSIAPPSGWESSAEPIRVNSLEPQASYTFNVVIKAPADTVTGDYMTTLAGSSGQVTSANVQVRITVTTPTSWSLYGIGLAAVFIVVLVAVFTRFRRR